MWTFGETRSEQKDNKYVYDARCPARRPTLVVCGLTSRASSRQSSAPSAAQTLTGHPCRSPPGPRTPSKE